MPPDEPAALAYTSSKSGKRYLVSLGLDTSLATARGYDDVTGVGSMTYRVAMAMAGRGAGSAAIEQPERHGRTTAAGRHAR